MCGVCPRAWTCRRSMPCCSFPPVTRRWMWCSLLGRVMRTFHKGLPDEKKYGYIIIPIVVPSDVSAEEALDNSKTFDVVWEILNALALP